MQTKTTKKKKKKKKKKIPTSYGLVWFDLCFTAIQHILGHFGRGHLT